MAGKNKVVFCLLYMGVVLSVLCACGRRSGMESKAQSHAGLKGESSVPYFDRDKQAIKKYLASYPDDNEALDESDILTVHRGYASGAEYWESFLEKVEKKEKCSIVIVTFSRVAEPIISYIEYNGTDYFHMQDFSRAEGFEEPRGGYRSRIYSDLFCLDVPEEEFDGIDFSKMKGTVQDIVLCKTKLQSYNDFVDYVNSDPEEYFNFSLYPLTEDTYLDVLKEEWKS